MPRYCYRCKSCDAEFLIVHLMSERVEDCEKCEAEASLIRIPSIASKLVVKGEKKPGAVVKQYLKDAKKEIEIEKKGLRTKDYKC